MPRTKYTFKARDKQLQLGTTTRLMGIVNITPDSFSDGGRFHSTGAALDHSLKLIESGADIIDIGGESSRPGSRPVSAAEEMDRILPLLESLRPETSLMISIDTCKAEVAEAALAAGADIINDISALRRSPEMGSTISRWDAGAILMHMRGEPASMHLMDPSPDILSEVIEDLKFSVDNAVGFNVPRDRIIIDPGIGFGKNHNENLEILNRLPLLEKLGLPLMIGTSRKRFIGAILDKPVSERIFGTIASSVSAIIKGVHILRVHDVAEVKEAAEVSDAIAREKLN